MRKFTHAPLFAGINGFGVAADKMGWEQPFHCEIDPFCQRIIQYYWPNSKPFYDIKSTDFTVFRGLIDILTGGFPCQPFSTAGKQKGTDDDRYLWPEMLRAIREIQPRWVVGENVRGLVSWNDGMVFDQVQSDLEAEGYEVLPFLLPAAGVNAPHQRYRIWFIAYANQRGGSKHELQAGPSLLEARLSEHGVSTDPERERGRSGVCTGENAVHVDSSGETERHAFHGNGWPTEPPLCFTNDGISKRLVGTTFSGLRRKGCNALGNAIVPQVALQIFKAIYEFEKTR